MDSSTSTGSDIPAATPPRRKSGKPTASRKAGAPRPHKAKSTRVRKYPAGTTAAQITALHDQALLKNGGRKQTLRWSAAHAFVIDRFAAAHGIKTHEALLLLVEQLGKSSGIWNAALQHQAAHSQDADPNDADTANGGDGVPATRAA